MNYEWGNVWDHSSPLRMATNRDPLYGGIVDKAIVSQKWFAISNSDQIQSMEGFDTKQEAIDYLTSEAKAIMLKTSQYREYY